MKQRLKWNLPSDKDVCMGVVDVRTVKSTTLPKPTRPKPWAEIRDKGEEVNAPWATIYEPSNPAPAWNTLTEGDQRFFGPYCFGIVEGSDKPTERIRRVTLQETLQIMGLPTADDSPLLHEEDIVRKELPKSGRRGAVHT